MNSIKGQTRCCASTFSTVATKFAKGPERTSKVSPVFNVDGAKNVALVSEQKGIDKIVSTSTIAAYGFAEPGTDQRGAINPFDEYGRTKFEAEEKHRQWHALGDNALIIVRPTVIFGEGNRENVFNLLNQIASGSFIMVGRGEIKKSVAYFGNIAMDGIGVDRI